MNYVDEFKKVWTLGPVYNILSFKDRGSVPDRLVFEACRQAVAEKCVEKLLGGHEKDAFPNALTSTGIGDKPYREFMLLAHLVTAKYVCEHRSTTASDFSQDEIKTSQDNKETIGNNLKKAWEAYATAHVSTDGPLAGVPDPLDGFLRDLAMRLHPSNKIGMNLPNEASEEVTVLFVGGQENKGVSLTLTLELCKSCSSNGGTLYPDPQHAFIFRDQLFLEAERNAAACVMEDWPKGFDVRWRLKRLDRETLGFILTGNSAGLAFTMGLKKLLLRATDLCDDGDQG